MAPTPQELLACKMEVAEMIKRNKCNPIMVRLAWHDSGTYDMARKSQAWPIAGGAVGSIRFDKEITAGPNAGLSKAIKYLDPIKKKFDSISWADLIQMGSATAIELAGGPKINMTYGRVDAPDGAVGGEAPFGLPDARPDFGMGPGKPTKDPAEHLRYVFGKYDSMTDQDIVALSGAHTLGRAFKERSGTVENGYNSPTKFTCPAGMGMKGGKSWTKNWLTFDNSYFQYKEGSSDNQELAWFPTDNVLASDPGFKPYWEKYAADQSAFFKDYAVSHEKLSELGANYEAKIKLPGDEDEFANRDAQGLTPDKGVAPADAEAKTAAGYFKMIFLIIPMVGQALAWSIYFGTRVVVPGMAALLDQKLEFIYVYDLGYVYFAVWVLGCARARLTVNANAARAAARVDRPDQHIYKIMDSAAPESTPYILMANTGAAGRFNRAQRGVFNTDESLPLVLTSTLLVGAVFGPVVLVLAVLAAYGRVSFGLGYKDSPSGRGSGFMIAMIGEQLMMALVLLIAVKGTFYPKIPF